MYNIVVSCKWNHLLFVDVERYLICSLISIHSGYTQYNKRCGIFIAPWENHFKDNHSQLLLYNLHNPQWRVDYLTKYELY